ncbi:MAG: hypothetical protein U0S12_11485 [Fimbriimonadales bacterium]
MIFALLLASPDYEGIALAFLRATGPDLRGCSIQRRSHAIRSGTVEFELIENNHQPDQRKPYRHFVVDLDLDGRVVWASNYGLVHRRVYRLYDASKKVLTREQAHAALKKWAKKWPAPPGYVERSFTYADERGDSWSAYDRNVSGYWLGESVVYSIDTRSGEMSRFGAPKPSRIGVTKLTVSRADAIKVAQAALGDVERRYGKHYLTSCKVEFERRPDSKPGTSVADLGYTLRFAPFGTSHPTLGYRGATVRVSADGKLLRPPSVMQVKGG